MASVGKACNIRSKIQIPEPNINCLLFYLHAAHLFYAFYVLYFCNQFVEL